MKAHSLRRGILTAVLFLALGASRAGAQSNRVIYQDSLASGWDDWSWNCTRDFSSTVTNYSGLYSLMVRITNSDGGLGIHCANIIVTNYHLLDFYVHGGTNRSMDLKVYITAGGNSFTELRLTNYLDGRTLSNVWKRARIPMVDFNITSQVVDKLNWSDPFSHAWGPIYFDNIILVNTNTPAGDTNVVNDFSITSKWNEADGSLAIEFSGQTCAYYQVWISTTLLAGAWSEAGVVLGTELPQVWTNLSTADTTFVKFSGLLHKDSWDADGDGLLDDHRLAVVGRAYQQIGRASCRERV